MTTTKPDMKGVRRRIRELTDYAKKTCDIPCYVGASAVCAKYGGQMYGYYTYGGPGEDQSGVNEAAIVGKSVGGHDFVVVDGRYLVDAWASEVEGIPLPVVIDLATKIGQATARTWYGPSEKWTAYDLED